MGGEHFRSDDAFISSAVQDVRRLELACGLSEKSRLVDWGCGAGRLAFGVRESLAGIESYHGIDVQPELIAWAQENLRAENFQFTLAGAQNERYNPNGYLALSIPVEDNSTDVFYAYSVFSHMTITDTAIYLRAIRNLLSSESEGRAFVTCFVEEDVPDWSENPPDYGPMTWQGRLHCARFARSYLGLLHDAGLSVQDFEYGQETDGQSLYILG